MAAAAPAPAENYGIRSLKIDYIDDVYHQLDGRFIEAKGYTYTKTISNHIEENNWHLKEMPSEELEHMGISLDTTPVYYINELELVGCKDESITVNAVVDNIEYTIVCPVIKQEDYNPATIGQHMGYSQDHKIGLIAMYSELPSRGVYGVEVPVLTTYNINEVSMVMTCDYVNTETIIEPLEYKFMPYSYDLSERGEAFNDNYNTASGRYSHAEGGWTRATGSYSHSEGEDSVASGPSSHAEGQGGQATADCTHAEGYRTVASEDGAHAEGWQTEASGACAHAEGIETEASGNYSHASNIRTIAGYEGQTAIGKYNNNKSGNLFEIGNGGIDGHSNAMEVTEDGTVYASDFKCKNLLPNTTDTQTIEGVTFTRNQDGTISLSGTATANAFYTLATLSLDTSKTYTLSGCPAEGDYTNKYSLYTDIGSQKEKDEGEGVTFTPTSGSGYFYIVVREGQDTTGLVFKPQLETGEKASSYTKYKNFESQPTVFNINGNVT